MLGGRWLGRTAGVLGALLIWSLTAGQAMASVAACYRLAKVVNPADFKIAYKFVTQHGQCLADFDDPAFDAVAAGLTSLQVAGAINAGTCSALLNDVNSPAVKTLQQAVPDLNIVSEYLDCGCAVAESGIADRIKGILNDMKSCASSFDPSGVIESGLNKAGTALGFSTLWGLSSNAPDPRAGVGNGGAPTTAYICGAGGWFYENGQCSDCSGPGEKYYDQSHPGQFWCQPCAKGQALQSGTCAACPSLGPQSFNSPNPTRTQCIGGGTGQVSNPCQPSQKWNGGSGGSNVCCNADQKIITVQGHDQCLAICQDYQDYKGGQCIAKCPSNRVWQNGACQVCPANKQPNGYNGCNPCPAGSTSTPGGICTAAFPLPQCFGNQINPPANPYQCTACPAGTFPNPQRNACYGFTCQGNAVPDPNRANTCMLCDKGTAPNAQRTACVPVGVPRGVVLPNRTLPPRQTQ